jgi:glutathione synthase/RimK-type ligase-like ATP-grasp enzyme
MSVLDYLFGLESQTQRDMARTSLEEADLVYASSSDRDTKYETAERLQERGYNVTSISFDDVEQTEDGVTVRGHDPEVLEDTTVFYMEESYLPGRDGNRDQHREAVREIQEAAGNVVNPVEAAAMADDKRRTNEILERNGVNTPRHFDTADELNEYVEEEGAVVAKNRSGSLGSGFELIDNPVEELDDDKVYQEAVDQTQDHIEERRGYMVGERPVAVMSRGTGNDEIEPQNCANGGEYWRPDDISIEELATLRTTSRLFGGGTTAVDYFRNTETGEVTVLEPNKTPGIRINESAEEDVYDHITEHLVSEMEDESFDSSAPEPVEDLVRHPEIDMPTVPDFTGPEVDESPVAGVNI